MAIFLWWEKKGSSYGYDDISGSCFAQEREYDPKAGRFLDQDVIGGNIIHPKTWNRYRYCWCNPWILVDLDGRFPSWSASDQGKVAEDANRAFIEGIGDVKASVSEGISDLVEGAVAFYEQHETEIQVGVAIGSTAVGGILGGFANERTGGSLMNDFVGGFVWNFITESLHKGNIDNSNDKKGQDKILLISLRMGYIQVGLGKIGIWKTMSEGVGLAKGSAGHWIAKFFDKNLNFTSSLSAYILIDGLL